MLITEYESISKELQELSKTIPLYWGAVQNDETDAKLNLFYIKNKLQLETKIADFKEKDKNYFRRRWFLWQCARVDEYLFYNQNNIKKNPNSKDKNWDIEFNKNADLRFDVKSTIVPKKLRTNFTIADEEKTINFYYQNQSKGVRNHLQNRLFIVHHSFYKPERSLFLRCYWNLKAKAYQHFYNQLKTNINFVSYKTVIAKCIFIFETEKNVFSYTIV
jgi:hypothetical protein